MNAWFTQLNRLIARKETGELSEETFQEYKKRLQNLHTELNGFEARVAQEKSRFANDDTFQMQLLELQIESDDWELEDREQALLAWRAKLENIIAKALSRQTSTSAPTENFVSTTLTPIQKATLQKETQNLVNTLREQIHIIRSERLDPEIWTTCNQIEDELYRNGSEDVERWSHRVQVQQKRLQAIPPE